MAYKRNMTFFLWFPECKISRDDLEISDRKCLTFYSSSTHVILIDYPSHLPVEAERIGSSTAELVCFEPGSHFTLLINEYGRKIV